MESMPHSYFVSYESLRECKPLVYIIYVLTNITVDCTNSRFVTSGGILAFKENYIDRYSFLNKIQINT